MEASAELAATDDRLRIGGNQPPLGELLSEETRPFRERATALIENVNQSRIDSPETAAQVTQLGGMLADLKATVEEARKARAKPFDEGKSAVQKAFKADLIDAIDKAMNVCRKMLDSWRAELRRQEDDERRKREAEAEAERKRAAAAEAAKKAAEQAGDTGAAVRAEMEELQARDRAEALSQPSGTIRPSEPIRSVAGSATVTTQKVPVVTDIGQCLRWMIQNQPAALLEAINPLITRAIRAGTEIPGVRVETREATRLGR